MVDALKRRGPEIYLMVASVIWALVIIDTGEVGWPIAVWLTTALIPAAQRMHRRSGA